MLDLGLKQQTSPPGVAQRRLASSPATLPAAISGQNRQFIRTRPAKYLTAAQSSGLTSSVQLGPSVDDRQSNATSQNGAVSLEAVDLRSEAGLEYEVLRDALQEGRFQDADNETRALLINLAGPEAQKRGWVYFTEVKFIPEADLQTIDSLWRAASGNKFGYSAQKEIWLQKRRRWDKLFQEIDWVQGKNNVYRKWPQEFKYTADAAKGHLPLTNALRGTQLFKAIMEHPAFNNSSKSNPDWLS